MNTPDHYVVQKTTHEFRVPVPATARDLWGAVLIVDSWIKENEPGLAGYDDRFAVEVGDAHIALVITVRDVLSKAAS